jgi:hypothetical protein
MPLSRAVTNNSYLHRKPAAPTRRTLHSKVNDLIVPSVTGPPDAQADVWSEWLLHRRHADDPNYGRVVQTVVQGYADRVLDGAQRTAYLQAQKPLT